MHDPMTVRDLILKLSEEDSDAYVMLTVVKYPDRVMDGEAWDAPDISETLPLEIDEPIRRDASFVYLTVELTDWDDRPSPQGSAQGSSEG